MTTDPHGVESLVIGAHQGQAGSRPLENGVMGWMYE